ncbi:histidine phosphatase superfamily [Xylariomycetidae sp. FL0641]|nr:histidine phosphatase superfamily [Xylariomycetidae sp. FL0641]
MAPTIGIIRHGEAWHNLPSGGGSTIRDPALTPAGEAQAYALGRAYPYRRATCAVVASPLRRAVQTATIAFENASPAVLLLPELQETGWRPSDQGAAPAALQAEFRGQVDASRLDRDWGAKRQGSPRWLPGAERVEARARAARVEIRKLARELEERGEGDAHVAVVTHGGFAHFLTQDFTGLGDGGFTNYGNAEFRVWRFADLTGEDGEARLVETEASREMFPEADGRYADQDEETRARWKSHAVARVEAQRRSFERATAPEGR